MSRPPVDELLGVCREVLDDPARGAADVERIIASGGDAKLCPPLARLLPDVPDPDLALVHLERHAREARLPADPESLSVLLTVFGFSPYLAESLLTDTGYLSELLRSRRQGIWGVEEYRTALARWLRIAHRDDPWAALRAFKRRTTLRIALRDLQRAVTLSEVCREISSAADALLQAALEIAVAEAVGRYGRPQAYDETGRIIDASMCVISLGKLGGVELNYSSDVDLLFLYSRDGETTGIEGGARSQVTNKEFFGEVARSLARGLGEISAEGQVFRVDCRLRPGGRDGDLVMPLSAALDYYDNWARGWERQALIKARSSAGDPELGASFLAGAEGIVYRDPPDPDIPESIRAMKDRIDADLARRGRGTWDLKLGRGGIREIEFTIQALQMVHGGKDPWVRGANTLLAMHRLADKGHLSVAEYGILSTAYTFLRETEHRLQLHRNLQRSSLPQAPRDRRILARALGYRDGKRRQEESRLLADLEAHREAVRSAYDAILGRLSQATLDDSPAPDPFLDRMSDAEVVARLGAAGIAGAESLLGSVKAIARLLDAASTPPDIRREFRKVTPPLLKGLAGLHRPVRALRNMERFLASMGLEPAQMAAFLGRRELIAPLTRLFGGSQLLSSTLIHRPGLVLESGFDLAIAKDRSVSEHFAALAGQSARLSDDIAFAAFLRVYQRTQLLYIGLKDLSRNGGPAAAGRALSDLAEAILGVVIDRCAAAEGWIDPVGRPGERVRGFVSIGLGKLGYRELDYSSDLDLVFLYEESDGDAAQRHAQATRLASRTMEMLTAITREGSLYAVDTRLRPFGGEGELAQSLRRLSEYLASTAGVWELQSMLKARPLAGDIDLGWRSVRLIERLALEGAARADLAQSVTEMKQRLEREAHASGKGSTDIKLGPGGLNAIQFAIQYLQLAHGIPSPSHKRTTRLLATLRGAGLLDEDAYRVFFTGFQFLRRLQHRIRLIQGRSLSRLPTSPEDLEEIAAAMEYEPTGGGPARAGLLADLERHLHAIEATYRRVIERAGAPERIEA